MMYHDFNRKGSAPRNAMTRDHVIPKSYGGAGFYKNIVIACSQCNSMRGNIHAHVFYRLMEEWKKRDSDFAKMWYYLDRSQLWRYKMEVLLYQKWHLKSRRRSSREDFGRYDHFITHHGSYLSAGRTIQMSHRY